MRKKRLEEVQRCSILGLLLNTCIPHLKISFLWIINTGFCIKNPLTIYSLLNLSPKKNWINVTRTSAHHFVHRHYETNQNVYLNEIWYRYTTRKGFKFSRLAYVCFLSAESHYKSNTFYSFWSLINIIFVHDYKTSVTLYDGT